MQINQIKLRSWRQFDQVDIKLHPRLTILAGENGTGKTTLLNLINHHFGWATHLVGHTQGKSADASQYRENSDNETFENIGEIVYANDQRANLLVPIDEKREFPIYLENPPQISGVHIPSHRPVFNAQPLKSISIEDLSRKTSFEKYATVAQQRYNGVSRSSSEINVIKETLFAAGILGYDNGVFEGLGSARELWEGFQDVLSITLPENMGFEKLILKDQNIWLKTQSDIFPLDGVSGGIAAIIDIVWQIYTYGSNMPFVVTIDEPENHLHPVMQRTLLSRLTSAFPLAQFVIASHNPLIINSESESFVYLLKFKETHKTESLWLEDLDHTSSPEEILYQVLGLNSIIPVWAENRMAEIIARYKNLDVNPDRIREFKQELKAAGLGKYISLSLTNWLNRKSVDVADLE